METTESLLDLFTIGIGPSSSHTVGPMRAGLLVRRALEASAPSAAGEWHLGVELFGSLSATGRGHGTHQAVTLGLAGHDPETLDPGERDALVGAVRAAGGFDAGGRRVRFDPDADIRFQRGRLPRHPNGMRFTAVDESGTEVLRREVYSVGGGYLRTAEEDEAGAEAAPSAPTGAAPAWLASGQALLAACRAQGLSIPALVRRHEEALAGPEAVRRRLAAIASAMESCVERGCHGEGDLPGGLRVARRAPRLYVRLLAAQGAGDPLSVIDWVSCFALAASEENASGGRVVTAPTNGAAGVLPAVLLYLRRFHPGVDAGASGRLLLTAAAVGALYRRHSSLSGAEVGCQGEIGVACSMAAAGLAAALGATDTQVENAAEIGMEHHLGLTCDPVGGLVQIPCIERNAVAALTAIQACRLALGGDGSHRVSLDNVIATMLQTGRDMKSKYKETALGGLKVSQPEC